MEVIILGNPFLEDSGTVTPIIVPAYQAEEAVIELTTGYDPYVIGSNSSDLYWTRSGVDSLRPVLTTDKIIIGGSSLISTETLRVVGGINSTLFKFGTEVTYVISIKDEDNLVSNDEHAIPTQQSVKAYVDSQNFGLQPGDNVSLLTNDVPYLIVETDPIFIASPSFGITSTQITHWDTAYSWGNHATVGYIITETDPIFVASVAHSITGTDIIHWNDAYSKEHVHSNISLLNSLISSGSGTSALFDDGTYKVVTNLVGGSNTNVQYNDNGVLNGDSTFFFDNTTKLLSIQDISITNGITLGSTGVTLTVDGSNNLVFTDSISGSKTLASLIGGATNYWTTTTGGIYYSNDISNHINPAAELDITGHIIATDFDSNYIRYKNSNLLIGPNAGDLETGNYLLYIAEDNTTIPLIKGDFLNQEITFNADTYINTVKRLAFGDSLVSIRRDGSGNMEFQDLNANGGLPILLSDFITGNLSLYSLKSDFISYTSVNSISAANLVTWGKASVIITSGGGTNFLGDDGLYHAGGGGGVTPTDGIFKFDLGTVKYRPYTDKTEAGGVSSSGKFYLSTSNPTATNRLNYDGIFFPTGISIIRTDGVTGISSTSDSVGLTGICTGSTYGVYGQGINNAGVYGVSSSSSGIYGKSTSGPGLAGQSDSSYGLYINNTIGNNVKIIRADVNFVEKFSIDKDGNINSLVLNTSGTSVNSGYFYTGTNTPIDTTRLNYDGYFYATKLYSGGNEVLTSTLTVQAFNNAIVGTTELGGSINISSFIDIDIYNPLGHTLTYSWIGPSGYISTTKSDTVIPAGLYTVTVTDTNNGRIYQSSTYVYAISCEANFGIPAGTFNIGRYILTTDDFGVRSWIVAPKILKDFYIDVTTSGTSTTDLYSYTIPDNILLNNGDKIVVNYAVDSGTSVTGTLLVSFGSGGTGSYSVTSETNDIIINITFIRVSSSVLRYYRTGCTPSLTSTFTGELTGLDFTTTNILKLVGTASSGTFTAKLGFIEYKPAAI